MATFYIDNRATGAGTGASLLDAFTSIAALTGITSGSVVEFVKNSGPYIEAFDIKANGTLANPVVWNCNGCEVSRKVDLCNPATYKWTQSTLGSTVWYVTLNNGTTTGLVSGTTINNPNTVTVDGRLYIASTGGATDNQLLTTSGIAAAAEGRVARGDADTLGFNTFYIKSTGNPALKHKVFAATSSMVLDASWRYHTINDCVFSYANTALVRARARSLTLNNCTFKYSEATGFAAESTETTDNTVTITNPTFYWTGHRAITLQVNTKSAVTVTGATIVGTHLAALIDTGTIGTLTFTGSTSAYLTAGGIDNKTLDVSKLIENNNKWYPLFTESQNGLAYVSLAGWPQTASTDLPSSKAGNDGVAANYQTDPNFVKYSIYGIENCDFTVDTRKKYSTYLNVAPNVYIGIS